MGKQQRCVWWGGGQGIGGAEDPSRNNNVGLLYVHPQLLGDLE